VLLEIEELLRFDHGEGSIDVPALEEVAERAGCCIAGIVPALKSDECARPAEEGSFEASYRIHPRKAIGQVS
jgi:hypothetical protein